MYNGKIILHNKKYIKNQFYTRFVLQLFSK